MQGFKIIKLIFTILLAVIMLTACAKRHEQNTRDSLPGYTKPYINQNDIDIISGAAGLGLESEPSDDFLRSMSRLHRRGCKDIISAEKTNEKDGWTYFTVTDSDGQIFYVDTNQHGLFGTILTQEGKSNAELIVKTLGLSDNRNILYTAEVIEINECGLISEIKDIEHKKAYTFTVMSDNGKEYRICIGDNGELGYIKDMQDNDIWNSLPE